MHSCCRNDANITALLLSTVICNVIFNARISFNCLIIKRTACPSVSHWFIQPQNIIDSRWQLYFALFFFIKRDIFILLAIFITLTLSLSSLTFFLSRFSILFVHIYNQDFLVCRLKSCFYFVIFFFFYFVLLDVLKILKNIFKKIYKKREREVVCLWSTF